MVDPYPLASSPQGEYLVEYLGTPIKLLVIDDYKGYGRRYFFSTDLNDTAEDIITTWENRWDIEVLIRELKALGLEGGSFLTWVRNSGFVALKALSPRCPILQVLHGSGTRGQKVGQIDKKYLP
ncbi:Second ORF in transposon ISC1217 [Saccharolobus solfataricus P2]|uniref:Second ORF in transposon ISC1217 n=2 Tax=Saccharolobus solfataricus TaxID=2287 RepID=Q97ZR9_SACS2|nr:Second ORF in transposon ISC1217 [Saccharolobus solfataricus P2]SAI84050.1 ORF2 in transposon ISC1217 [Saccharolobus solfataricus]